MDTHRARVLVVSMLATFAAVRILLGFSPNSDFDVAGYNVHHLFTGLLLIVAGGLPLALFPGRSIALDAATVAFGAGLALTLDEWVYLIATDGSNASYLLPISLTGALMMIGMALVYVLVLYLISRRR